MVWHYINRAKLFAAMAIAMSAMSLIGPATAQAAPPCRQWGFGGDTSFNQSNGWAMWFNSTGPRAQGKATSSARGPDGQPVFMYGTIDGGIDGYAVNLSVRWDGGQFGKYDGSVDSNGFASGTTYDVSNPGSSAGWRSGQPLRCITPG